MISSEDALNWLFQDNNRGVVRTNPNRGRLAGKLERQKKGDVEPELPEAVIVRPFHRLSIRH